MDFDRTQESEGRRAAKPHPLNGDPGRKVQRSE